MKTSQIKQVVSSVWRNMEPTRYLSSSRSVCNIDKAYHGRIELDSHADTTFLGSNCVILTYTGKEWKESPYSDEYDYIQYVPVVTGDTAWTCPHSGEKNPCFQ